MTYLPKRLNELTQTNFLTALSRCITWWEIESAYLQWVIQFPSARDGLRRIADQALTRIELQ